MPNIQLLSVENLITRKKGSVEQTLEFFMLVDNINYDKQVEVVWAREDGVWQILTAHFYGKSGQNKEYWQAKIKQIFMADNAPSGHIQFALQFKTQGVTYWDNQQGLNYSSKANSGLNLANALPLLNIDFSGTLADKAPFFPVTIAVDASLNAEQVFVHWTTDNWQHTTITPCHTRKHAHNRNLLSPPKPNKRRGTERWKARLNIKDAFRLQYCISFVAQGKTYWDNNLGQNYSAQHAPLKIMILNLHCYQEDNQDHKFSQIAKAINDLAVDIICLQEVAEYWNNGEGDWHSNAARIINERLTNPFHLHTDWSHLGFDQYREGVAILSRFPIVKHAARYVSESHDPYSINSRKVVMAQIPVLGVGLINVFSAHLSWWEGGFADQFKQLGAWAADNHTQKVKATLLCGDFNIAAGSKGYDLVVNLNEYDDQFLAANSQGVFDKIFKVNDPYWHDYLSDDYRIDYIFMDKASKLRVTSGMVLFTDQDYGRVSDHCGYLMSFEPK
ncbi:MAG: endonuclease [Methylococcaceae bacterium]|nr:endonuclease [Methylococcaceae bacterium]